MTTYLAPHYIEICAIINTLPATLTMLPTVKRAGDNIGSKVFTVVLTSKHAGDNIGSEIFVSAMFPAGR